MSSWTRKLYMKWLSESGYFILLKISDSMQLSLANLSIFSLNSHILLLLPLLQNHHQCHERVLWTSTVLHLILLLWYFTLFIMSPSTPILYWCFPAPSWVILMLLKSWLIVAMINALICFCSQHYVLLLLC